MTSRTSASTLGSVHDARGWVLGGGELALLEEEGGALRLIDAEGGELGRLSGAAAGALRARLEGAPLSPLLARVLGALPGLAHALEAPALPLEPTALLGRRRWGQLFVELLARCNERCLHCYAGSDPHRPEALARETVLAALRDAAALGFEVVQLTGGEPLLCPFVAEAAAFAREAGVPLVEVYTNGVLLDERRYAALRASDVAFAFSLYAAEPARHDEVTRLSGSHARTLAAIRRALAGGSPVRVGVVAVRPDMEPDALAAGELAVSLGVAPAQVRLQVAHSVGRGEHGGRPTPQPSWWPRPASAGAPSAEAAADAEELAGDHARVRGGRAAILPDGTVTPCIFSRTLVLGRVGPAGGLREALERPAVRIAAAHEAVRDLTALRSALSCTECRWATALLRPAARVLPRA